LVKFVFCMCHPRISSRISWLKVYLYSYLLILVQSLHMWTSRYDRGGVRYVYI
jgi:hypothetical protein